MGTQIYILYNYKLYKLTIKIYVHEYGSISFCSTKMFLITDSKRFVSYFCNFNKNLYNELDFFKN